VNWLIALFLILHVGGAIIAFGPTFTFPFIGGMGGKEPMHVNFSLRVAERIEMRLVLPLAIFQAVTGVGLIWTVGLDVFAHLWLALGIVLYVIAMTIVLTNQIPVTRKLVEATSTPPPPPAPGSPPPSGPPPHIAALVRRNQLGGMVLTVLLLTIIVLMVGGTNGYIG
jgi:Predicted integral membrane protein (DUF2269)